jgi:dienelactone hydrolase
MFTVPHAAPPPPANRAEWDARRATLRQQAWALLGDLPPLFTPHAEELYIEQRDGYTLTKLSFDNGAAANVPGYLLLPDPCPARVPAVLFHHLHGNKYWLGKDELFDDPVTRQQRGVRLVNAGFAVLAIDAYAFGERQHQGPGGRREAGAATEHALFKQLLWRGSTLWGMMVRDDLLALNYLCSRPEIDTSRLGATGMSLGGTRSTWLAALDERIAVCIPVAQMTRYREYDAQGDYSLHSFYYYVPGLLKTEIEMEVLVSLAAPRAQRILIGADDPLSPASGVQTVDRFARAVYDCYGAAARFETRLYPGVAHQYTAPMLDAMVEGFQHFL